MPNFLSPTLTDVVKWLAEWLAVCQPWLSVWRISLKRSDARRTSDEVVGCWCCNSRWCLAGDVKDVTSGWLRFLGIETMAVYRLSWWIETLQPTNAEEVFAADNQPQVAILSRVPSGEVSSMTQEFGSFALDGIAPRGASNWRTFNTTPTVFLT